MILAALPSQPRCVLAVHALAPLPRPDTPDAGAPFLPKPALSVAHLVHEVQSDKTVRMRYASYFHVPVSRIVPFLQHNIQAGVLARGGWYTVFFYSHTGTLYPGWMLLSAHTPVFEAKKGEPELLLGSGNPLIPFVAEVDNTVTFAPQRERKPVQIIIPAAGVDTPVAAGPAVKAPPAPATPSVPSAPSNLSETANR